MRFAEKLRLLRTKAGLSQPDLASASGVPLGTIRTIEQGLSLPGWGTLTRLSTAIGASLGDWEGVGEEVIASRTVAKKKK